MKNKTLEFLKNGAIATIPFVAGGVAGAELTGLITDNEAIISGASTATQYVAGYGAFMGLTAHDNKDLYKKNDKWDYKKLAIGTAKTVFSLGIAEIPYIFGRTGLMDYFMNKDYSRTSSSLLADAISIPLFFLVAVPIAKKTGLIRDTQNLDLGDQEKNE